MIRFLLALAWLALVGCSSSAPPSNAEATSEWRQAGYRDAMAGKAVRDNDTLTEWYGSAQVDREAYLSGYTAGQAVICRPDMVRSLGTQGKDFPASCDGFKDAEPLRHLWLAAVDQLNR